MSWQDSIDVDELDPELLKWFPSNTARTNSLGKFLAEWSSKVCGLAHDLLAPLVGTFSLDEYIIRSTLDVEADVEVDNTKPRIPEKDKELLGELEHYGPLMSAIIKDIDQGIFQTQGAFFDVRTVIYCVTKLNIRYYGYDATYRMPFFQDENKTFREKITDTLPGEQEELDTTIENALDATLKRFERHIGTIDILKKDEIEEVKKDAFIDRWFHCNHHYYTTHVTTRNKEAARRVSKTIEKFDEHMCTTYGSPRIIPIPLPEEVNFNLLHEDIILSLNMTDPEEDYSHDMCKIETLQEALWGFLLFHSSAFTSHFDMTILNTTNKGFKYQRPWIAFTSEESVAVAQKIENKRKRQKQKASETNPENKNKKRKISKTNSETEEDNKKKEDEIKTAKAKAVEEKQKKAAQKKKAQDEKKAQKAAADAKKKAEAAAKKVAQAKTPSKGQKKEPHNVNHQETLPVNKTGVHVGHRSP